PLLGWGSWFGVWFCVAGGTVSCATDTPKNTKSAKVVTIHRCPTPTPISLTPTLPSSRPERAAVARVVEGPAVRSSVHPIFSSPVAVLFSRHRHPFDPQRRTSQRPSELEVIPDLGNIVQHVFQISGDCDLFDRIRQLTILDP